MRSANANKDKIKTLAQQIRVDRRSYEMLKAYLKGLKECIERAKTMRGPQGPPGRAGPQGPQGQGVDPGVVSQTIEARIKAMHGSELDKAKRMAEEAVKRASDQGKQLERISR